MSRHITSLTWDQAPHLSPEAKKELWDSIPLYQRDARSRGIPQLGAGVIFPFPESEVKVPDFPIPDHWARGFALDAQPLLKSHVIGALDRDSGILYITSAYKRPNAEPSVHAAAIKQVGPWLPGVGDAAALVTDSERTRYIDTYKQLGLNIELPEKGVEIGIQGVYTRLSEGRLKVFASCTAWFEEFRLYRRNAKGQVVKKNDHLMDCCIRAGTRVWTSDGPQAIEDLVGHAGWVLSRSGSWARFSGARKTLLNVPVVCLTFDDGYQVTCTLDHPFLTPEGWRRADQMAGVDGCNAAWQRTQSWQFLQPLRSIAARATTCAASISSALASAFTGAFGKTPMGWPFLWDSTSTIATEIGPTISQKTLRFSLMAPTSPITSEATSEASRLLPWLQRVIGMGHPLAWRGTGSTTTEIPPARCTLTETSPADAAAGATGRATTARTGSAQTSAAPSRAKRLAWTAWNVSAWAVASLLWWIATRRRAPARADAVKCISVEPAGRADVYCLTVPGPSAFALENGLVVHNTRYLDRSGVARMTTPPLGVDEQLEFEGPPSEYSWLG